MLIEADSELYYRPAYIGHAGWIAIRTDVAATDWEHIADRVAVSWRLVAPKKLAEMITEITKGQLLVWRLATLKNENRATAAQISMAKRNSVETAINIAREARQMLGGMGITGEYPIMRHMMNLESVITYEGTHDIHLLITGMDVTGENAFK